MMMSTHMRNIWELEWNEVHYWDDSPGHLPIYDIYTVNRDVA